MEIREGCGLRAIGAEQDFKNQKGKIEIRNYKKCRRYQPTN